MIRDTTAQLVLLGLASLVVVAGTSHAMDDLKASGATPLPWISPDRQGEVQIEGGLAFPLSDLSAGFLETPHGMGAGRGYHLGLRVRFYPTQRLVATPNFSYIEFGAHEGFAADDELFTVRASILRYGIDFLYLTPGDMRSFRPFMGVGTAIARNMYREEFLNAKTEYLAGVNSVVGSLVAGMRWGDWDLSIVYEINRFTTGRIAYDGESFPYRWDSLLLRLSYALPRF